MKKIVLLFTFIFCLFLFPRTTLAVETINNWQSKITVNTNGTANITETIVYDFGAASRHGIFRTIPLTKINQDGKSFEMSINVLGVTDEFGGAYNYTTSIIDNNLQIKIGSANFTVTGVHTYNINYQVTGAITYFSDHDELYWNVTGNEWQIYINSASAQVDLPSATAGNIKSICYTGPSNSKAQNCKLELLTATLVNVVADYALPPSNGLTFAVSFPKGIVQVVEPKPISSSTSTDKTSPLMALLIIIGTFLWYVVAPFTFILLWFIWGRDPNVGQPPTAWYDPPLDKSGRKLTPAEVGTLIDEKADSKDLTATIVSLAIKGYLKIKEEKSKLLVFKETKYTFIKQKEFKDDKSLQEHETLLLEKIFHSTDIKKVSDLKEGSFYLTFDKFQKLLYQKVVDLGYFKENPNSVRTRYYILSGLSLVTFNIPLAIIGFIISGSMPKKTLDGAKAKNVALGMKNFLVTQERQLEFQSKNWMFFEKLLPFAIVFGVEKIWAERFKDLNVKAPDWYEGNWSTFNTVYFVNSLSNSFNSVSAATISPTRSSSGFSSGFSGGSSGGGGGGGGGGSW